MNTVIRTNNAIQQLFRKRSYSGDLRWSAPARGARARRQHPVDPELAGAREGTDGTRH